MTYAIRTEGLTKRFKERVAVDDISLAIEEGEFYALLGINGAGKSTSIKMMTGVLRPDSGEILLLGIPIGGKTGDARRYVSVSPQETAVAPNLTVKENLVFMARVYGMGKQDAISAATAVMEKLSIADRAGDRAKTLSGGLQRRLSIAMALVTEPKILFLDEPTLGLDVISRRELWELMRSLKGNATVVLTTHYLEEAAELADRIGIMKDGRLCAEGTVGELIALSGEKDLEEAFIALSGHRRAEI